MCRTIIYIWYFIFDIQYIIVHNNAIICNNYIWFRTYITYSKGFCQQQSKPIFLQISPDLTVLNPLSGARTCWSYTTTIERRGWTMSSLVVTEGTPTFDTLVNWIFFQTTGVLLTPFFGWEELNFAGVFWVCWCGWVSKTLSKDMKDSWIVEW